MATNDKDLAETKIFNSTDTDVEISVSSSDGQKLTRPILKGETRSFQTQKGLCTICIVSPIEDPSFKACYTVFYGTNLIIVKKYGLLSLKRASYSKGMALEAEDHVSLFGLKGELFNFFRKFCFNFCIFPDLYYQMRGLGLIRNFIHGTQILNSTSDLIKLKLTDSKNRETTQILNKNESCVIVTEEGINIVQIVNKKGKIEGSFTIKANVIYSQIEQNTAYGTLLSDVLNKELLIVKSKGRKVDFKFGTISLAQNGMLVYASN